MTMPRIKGHLTYEEQSWIIVSFRVDPPPVDPPSPQATPRPDGARSPMDGAEVPPPLRPEPMAQRGPSMDFIVDEDGQVLHQASGQPQRVSATWVIGRRVKPDVQRHSWVPGPTDFEEVLELTLRDGVVTNRGTWAPRPTRSGLAYFVAAVLGLAVLWSSVGPC